MRLLPSTILAAVFLLASCGRSEADREDRYGVGYRDGYAVGYNTTCEIRATLVEGDWQDEDYAHGYADGQTAGTIACNDSRRSE